MKREVELLESAAKAMDKGEDPFDLAFLSKHRVTLDEAYTLAEQLAIGARLFIRIRVEIGEGGLAATVAGNRLAEALVLGS